VAAWSERSSSKWCRTPWFVGINSFDLEVKMKFGVFDHMDHSGVPLGQQLEERLRLIEAYDRGGFHAYHLAEHHGTPLGLAPSPGVFLGAVAQRTSRLRFGPLVYMLPLYHPLRLIEEICMLDQMSGGRLELGVGAGVSPVEVGFYGVDFGERRRRYIETLDVILMGLMGDVLTHHGEFFTFDRVPIVVSPIQRPHPPLWYGLRDPESAVWPAANGVNLVVNGPAAMVRKVTDRYRAEWVARGRSERQLPLLGMNRMMVVADSKADAQLSARRAYPSWRANIELLWKAHGVPFPLKLPTEFAALQQQGAAFAGTASEARDYVAEQIQTAGINYFVCDIAFGTLTFAEAMRTTTLLVQELLPTFAERNSAAP
jgi:alkanesulfonate monooxygenase SsuD/methylene tetrahydromethanopterin reductase-like flavin-dependent oxidoreductase (luciferase family)